MYDQLASAAARADHHNTLHAARYDLAHVSPTITGSRWTEFWDSMAFTLRTRRLAWRSAARRSAQTFGSRSFGH